MTLEHIGNRINGIKVALSKKDGVEASGLREGLLKQFVRDIASGESKGKEVLDGAKMIVEIL
ncbi:MAG: hypothetical protein Q7T51_04560 [Candidatus Moranbacteria bacterium]|nr:hypothetical protein [Candidatus Moranbacteria bacterium]